MRVASKVAALLVLSGLFAGCSISESVSSPFESSASSIASSSGSSSDGRESYRNEVRDYTDTFVRTGGQVENFDRGLDTIASRHGVTNWEADEQTYIGIGAGLKKAGLSAADRDAWVANLSGGDATRAAWIRKGYGE